MDFPQLYTISSYSLLQSTLQVPRLVQEAKKQGYQTIGLCDRNVLAGAAEFYQVCQKEGMQAIIGLHLDYFSDVQGNENELLLFAKNLAGYQKLIQLSSEKMITGQVTLEKFGKLTDLIGIFPERNEPIYLKESQEIAEERLKEIKELFEAGNLYYGISPQFPLEEELVDWWQKNGIPPCGIYRVNTAEEDELPAITVMEHIKNGTQLEDFQQITVASQNSCLQPVAELTAHFSEEAVENAIRVGEACQWTFPLHQTLLPHYPVEQPSGEFLKELCWERLPQRVETPDDRYQQRLTYELSVIHQMGFDDYFLIVWDVMDFAHQQKIVTGAGRGSAAGSLVAYVLGITDVDPIRYQLLFERFLNPERYTMPDIDLDIPDNRREEVLHYVQEKYGKFQVAQIATFGTMAAKMVLRDVGRVFGLSQSEANRWSKAVPNALKMTLNRAYQESAKLRELVESSEKNSRMFQIAQLLEGLPRHVSTHAAGVVISDQNLLNFIPLQEGSEGILLTQFTMNDVEAVGLLKMDFLGLRNLSIIDNTLQGIQRITGKQFSQKNIPLDDMATLHLFQRGDTAGVFQFESAGIRNVLRRLEPESIEDIAAVNALYRPGPMQNIDAFIKRKKGLEKVYYPDESLRPILANTYGIMVYQEQIMQVASKLAGFTLGQADILRRAISKKKKTILDEERRHFVDGAMKNGHDKKTADNVYDYIERFANYGFNRSHAFAYSFVGFQMAYLKVHYPGPFFAALLHSVRHNPTKVKEYLNEAKKRKIQILPPSINRSSYSFQLQSLTVIRFGLSSLKGSRRDFVTEILQERKKNGPFTSFDQFLTRIDRKWLKEEVLRPLIEIGAFDELEPHRRQLASEITGKIQNVQYSGGSLDLLDVMTLKAHEVQEYQLEEKLALEEKYLGVYLSGHPAEQFTRVQRAKGVRNVTEILPNQKIHLLLYLREIREIRTKRGEQMAFIEGNDASGEVSVTIFPELYRQIRGIISENAVVYVEGKAEVSKYNGEIQVIADKVELAATIEAAIPQVTCYLRITAEKEEPDRLNQLYRLIQENIGPIPVVLYYAASEKKRILNEEYWVTDKPLFKKQLGELLGTENVVFK